MPAIYWFLIAKDVDEITQSFHAVVDEYLEDCKDEVRAPKKPFSGQILVRINPKLHRALFVKSKQSGLSLNAFIYKILDDAFPSS